MKRLLATISILTALGLGAVGLSGCSSVLGYAAKVNGATVSRTSMDQILADISANKDYVTQVDTPSASGATLGPVEGVTKGSYNKAFVALVLNEQIQAEVIHQSLAARHALPTAAEQAAARSETSQQFTPKIFDVFPPRYKAILVTQQAEADTFVKHLPAAQITDAALTQYYQAHTDRYQTEACVRHILIADKGADGQIDYPASLADANKVLAQLAGGADFAALAKTVSKDNTGTSGGSAAQGGALTGSATDGCFTSADLKSLITPFAQALSNLPLNKVSDPVKTQFGYHLIEITSRVIAPLDDNVKNDIMQVLALAQLNQLTKAAAVKVNPEFGTFSLTVTSTGHITGVVPPPLPGPVATTPPSTAAAGG